MEFRTELNWKNSIPKLDFQDNLLLLGSCFSENIGEKFEQNKFCVNRNPNGIIFHPLVISEIISRALSEKEYTQDDLLINDQYYFSWFHHSSLHAADSQSMLDKINDAQAQFRSQLLSANFLFFTFGTAFGYTFNSTKQLVANCHKVPANNFTKRLYRSEEILSDCSVTFNQLSKLNPSLKLFITVSPVRHIKDGIIENSRSKAELISAAHQLAESHSNWYYLPAFEWLIDDLRDYRFYNSDLVHPNSMAIQYLWEKILPNLLTVEAQKTLQTVQKINAAVQHRAFRPTSHQHQKFIHSTIKQVLELEESIQQRFNTELSILKQQLI